MTKPKIVFAPGCFDNLDMNQEELDEFVAKLESMVEDGSLFENSRPLDENDPQDAEIINKLIDAQDNDRKLQ